MSETSEKGTTMAIHPHPRGTAPLLAAVALTAAAVVALPASPAAATTFCEGIRATITGTEDNDHLIGTEGNDVIAALSGHDVVYGLGGSDRICLGTGNDIGYGGSGADRFHPDFGDDGVYDDDAEPDTVSFEGATFGVTVDLAAHSATGGAGTDVVVGIETVVGSVHDDDITGTDAGNSLFGGAGDDTIDGAGGGDAITPGAGDDHVDGGEGTLDVVSYLASPAAVTVNLTAGTGVGEGTDTLAGIERLTGSQFADRLIGDAGSNWIEGWGGNDTLEGRGGVDQHLGGPGSDTVTYIAAPAAVTASLHAGSTSGGHGPDLLMEIERLRGSAFADRLVGSTGVNVLRGGVGNDVLRGLSGNDTILGDAGDDSLDGGPDTDRCNGSSGIDAAVACETVTEVP